MLEDKLTKIIVREITKWAKNNSIDEHTEKKSFYECFTIRTGKAKAKYRRISAPVGSLKQLQRHLVDALNTIELPSYVHGFVPNRSIKTNAEKHIGQAIVLSMDIKDFFDSTTTKHVVNSLKKFIDNKEVVKKIASVCTLRSRLPQGAPTSPVLANIAFLDIDKKLDDLAKKNNGTYTRYADDITISSSDRGIYDMIRYIENIIKDGGYLVNKKKTRYASKRSRQMVTGLVVNEKVQPSSKYRYNFKAKLHNICKTIDLKDAIRRGVIDPLTRKESSLPLNGINMASINGEYVWIKTFNPQFATSQLDKYMKKIKEHIH